MQTSVQPTAGPWRSHLNSWRGSRSIIVSESTGRKIAEVFRSGSAQESHANATLLAAAPELREALVALLQAASPFDHETHVQRNFRESLMKAARQQATTVLASLGDPTLSTIHDMERTEDEEDDDLYTDAALPASFSPGAEYVL